MGIRMTGMISGLDTESIVAALMSAQKTKKTKIENKKQKLEWKQEIWSSLNTKLYSFYNTSLSKMRLQSGYNVKTASSSDSTKVKATVDNSAASGTYKIKVKALASAQYVTSGKVKAFDDSDVSKTTKLIDLGDGTIGEDFNVGTQIRITSGDKNVSLDVDEETTIDDFLSACKSAGLNASYDTKQGRLFISSQKSGADNNFTITAGDLTDDQKKVIDNIETAVYYDNLTGSQKSTFNSVLNSLQLKSDSDEEKKEKIDKAVEELNTLSDAAAKTKVTKYYTEKKTEEYKSQYFDADGNVTNAGRQALIDSGVSEEKIKDYSSSEYISKVNDLITKKAKEDVKDSAYQTLINNALENGLTVSTTSSDSTSTSEVIVKSKTDREADITTAVTEYEEKMENISSSGSPLKALGLGEIDGTGIAEGDTSTGMVVTAASDSEVEYNGVTLKSDTTDISIGGVTATLIATTGNDTVNITVTSDASSIYDSVKDFITEYNSILSELNTKYNAESSKGYEVLTDDQKKAMSDDEVDKWNTKIKNSLLRRDSTVDGLVSTMRNSLLGSVTASNGKKYSLANLGITTSTDYKENGLLHIKGDEDDSVYADSENTLKKMIEEDPNTVMDVMTGLLSNLYSKLGDKMGSTTLSSALTFYNDKEMTKQLKDYKKEISNWDTKLSTLENRYYSQFTAMEKAMASMQSKQNALSSYLG